MDLLKKEKNDILNLTNKLINTRIKLFQKYIEIKTFEKNIEEYSEIVKKLLKI